MFRIYTDYIFWLFSCDYYTKIGYFENTRIGLVFSIQFTNFT